MGRLRGLILNQNSEEKHQYAGHGRDINHPYLASQGRRPSDENLRPHTTEMMSGSSTIVDAYTDEEDMPPGASKTKH